MAIATVQSADAGLLKTAQDVRIACRNGTMQGPTTGFADGYVQCNLVILPADLSTDFLRFCQLNPKPCPLIGVSAVGEPNVPTLGEDLDIRTDLPAYRIWRRGELSEEVTDIRDYWRDDLVAFLLGCSFSFEEALIADGLKVRHIELGRNVPMYRTSIQTVPTGIFRGPLVVSMRPFKPADAIRAVQITSRFPAVHGAPIHIGKPELLGIADLSKPDYGDAVNIKDDELPVFWACGVTPQAVLAAAKVDFAITHAPGCMLVTDLRNSLLSVL